MGNYSKAEKVLKAVGKTLVTYGPAIFTCIASICSIQHEDAKNHKVAKEVAEMVMQELANKGLN